MSSRSVFPIFELILLFVVVYLLQVLTAFADLVGPLFVLQPPVTENPWTVVTSVFAHKHLGHLISNAISLVVFGLPVAMFTTRARFYTFFVTAGALAGISQIVFSDLFTLIPLVEYTASPGVLGASGGVFALLGYLLAGNRLSGMLGSTVDVPRWLSSLVFLGLAVVLTLVTASPGAALIAHFTGLLVGLLAGSLNLLDPGNSR
ncbi:rhomboid family intramembrane serine protease [Halovenus rubra]|uniref:Rhomboid family intramembrane serine protease n=2 Tax=Halovenus rubra TaxID=869890 RepID=A0ABD5X8Y2_9EURY|nr:rhomboid family intramembrane serine protease [Halovenus rubra]